MRADRVLRRRRRLELALLGERQPGDVREPSGVARGLEPRFAELASVERGAFEQVGELRAVACVVERELLVPRPALDLRFEHQSSGGGS